MPRPSDRPLNEPPPLLNMFQSMKTLTGRDHVIMTGSHRANIHPNKSKNDRHLRQDQLRRSSTWWHIFAFMIAMDGWMSRHFMNADAHRGPRLEIFTTGLRTDEPNSERLCGVRGPTDIRWQLAQTVGHSMTTRRHIEHSSVFLERSTAC